MAHHKRKRCKNRRAGCLMCKPHKGNGMQEDKPSVKRELQEEIEELVDEQKENT